MLKKCPRCGSGKIILGLFTYTDFLPPMIFINYEGKLAKKRIEAVCSNITLEGLQFTKGCKQDFWFHPTTREITIRNK